MVFFMWYSETVLIIAIAVTIKLMQCCYL